MMVNDSAFLDALEREAAQVQGRKPSWDVSFERSPTDRPKTSAWVRIEAGTSRGQITVWSSGECDSEVVSDSGELDSTTLLESPDDVVQVVTDWIAEMEKVSA